MKQYINGRYLEMTAEELACLESDGKKFDAQERHRPLCLEEALTLLLNQQINTIEVDDQTAVRMMAFYPSWEKLVGQTASAAGFKFTYCGKLYKTIAAGHTFQHNWIPGEGTESLYTRIDEEHTGDLYDPIPYEGNTQLCQGLHYIQQGVIYLCIRDSQQPVYNQMMELEGLYVQRI